ncbi:MAG: hypothetical protein IJP44_06315 [Bacteroidales bacterium]|nr:hypothetical protein [Bacteroidales bacterium]
MNALSLISALLLALAALLRGSAGRGAARRLMGKRHAEQYDHAANELCLFGRRLGQKAAVHHLANVGEEPLHLLPPSPSFLCAVGGARPKAGCGTLPRKARRWLGGSLCRMGKSTINYKTTF